jgi:hypothetical protein
MSLPRRSHLLVAATVVLVIALWAHAASPAKSPAGGQPLGLHPGLPAAVTKAGASQAAYDDFAWQLFIDLNWPARPDGKPDLSKIIGQAPEDPRVWDFFTDTTEIFHSSSLCSEQQASPKLKVLRMYRETTAAGLDVQAGSSWPLVDQNQNFAPVEVVANDVQKGYIVGNGLTTPDGLKKYIEHHSIVFPQGSMEVKAAWRLFPANTDPQVLARYHTKNAVICVAGQQSESGQPYSLKGTIGLVGLHIVYKTSNQPRWIWSTFEQVDNEEISYKPLPGLKPTFSDGKSTNGCTSETNRPPSPVPASHELYKWSSTQPTAHTYSPTQAARCANETDLPAAVNAEFQKALAQVPGVPNSPWQYYRLVATQWFDSHDHLQPRNSDGVAVSRNSTLETYLMGDQTIAGQVPAIGPVVFKPPYPPANSTLTDTIQATVVAAEGPAGPYTWSSCVVCHEMAAYQFGSDPTTTKDRVLTDFSFVFRSNLTAGDAAAPASEKENVKKNWLSTKGSRPN